MPDLDEGVLPQPSRLGIRLIAVFGILVFLLLARNATLRDPPEPPAQLLGCYSTPGGPDMLFEAGRVTVLQNGQSIEVKQTLEYHKGWAFSLERGLGYFISAEGSPIVDYGSKAGVFLFLSREGQVASQPPSFELRALGKQLAMRYVRSGDVCR